MIASDYIADILLAQDFPVNQDTASFASILLEEYGEIAVAVAKSGQKFSKLTDLCAAVYREAHRNERTRSRRASVSAKRLENNED